MSGLNWINRITKNENEKYIDREIIKHFAEYVLSCFDVSFKTERVDAACRNFSSHLAKAMTKNIDIAMAVERLAEAIANDLDFREIWKSNIAMAFSDSYYEFFETKTIHEISNKAADNFLNLLCKNGENRND